MVAKKTHLPTEALNPLWSSDLRENQSILLSSLVLLDRARNRPAARRGVWTSQNQAVTMRQSGKPDQPKGIGDQEKPLQHSKR